MNNVVDLKGRLPYAKNPDKSARPENVMPKQPRNFPKMPKAVWDELAPQLLNAGLLTDVDGISFGLLCRNVADMEKVEEKLKKIDDWIDTTPNGYKVQSVWFNMSRRLHDDILRLCKEFGMTPASRSTLKTNTADSSQQSLFDDDLPAKKDPYADYGPRAAH